MPSASVREVERLDPKALLDVRGAVSASRATRPTSKAFVSALAEQATETHAQRIGIGDPELFAAHGEQSVIAEPRERAG